MIRQLLIKLGFMTDNTTQPLQSTTEAQPTMDTHPRTARKEVETVTEQTLPDGTEETTETTVVDTPPEKEEQAQPAPDAQPQS